MRADPRVGSRGANTAGVQIGGQGESALDVAVRLEGLLRYLKEKGTYEKEDVSNKHVN